jgi:hypothetical protein
MNFDVRKRKTWAEEGGVSEVIGNILILMMTVVLFSGIIGFVQQMPVPEQSTKADFSATVSFSGNYRHANLTMVHAGGKVLDTGIVKIVINKDGVNYAYNLTDDPSFTGAKWTTGKSWTKRIDGTSASSIIIVTVVDLDKSDSIWSSQVVGGIRGNPPNILQRYLDSNPSSSTPDPVKEDDAFTLFVKIEDVDGDLNLTNIWIDASAVGIPGSNGNHRDYDLFLNGYYRWDFGSVENANTTDGTVVVIHASDTAGHEAVSSYVIDITVLPSDTNIAYEYAWEDVGSSGLPSYLSYISSGLGHGFGFYKEAYNGTTPRGKADTSQPTTDFIKDEKVFIRFASLTMSNLYVMNSLTITDTRTGNTYPPAYPDPGNSTTAAPFVAYPSGGSAYVYECVFNTSNLPPSAYTVNIHLKNQPGSGQTSLNFMADQMITVGQLDRSELFIPEVKVSKLDWSDANAWGSSRDTAFDISSADANTVYVKVLVQNTDTSATPTVSEIKIMDMSGGSQIYGVPPAGSMITQISRFDGTHYKFTMGLRLYNGDQWLPGTNAYTIYITRLNDSNEGVYSLSKQIWVKGAGGKADFITGSSGMASGNSNFNTREYIHYVQNNNFFTSRVLWQSESTPGSSADYTVTAMGAGDIDGDGDKDLLVCLATTNKLYLFENTLNIFGTWQSGSIITRPLADGETYPITSIAFGDINGDGDSDFAYSNSNSQIVLYNATYGSTGWVYNPVNKWSGTVAKIALEDMTGDGLADLIVLAGSKLWLYDIKYSYSLGLDKTKARFAYTSAATGIKDFDIEDMNGDGKKDILTTGTSGAFGSTAGVNVNYYTTGSGSPKYLSTAAGVTTQYGLAPSGQVSYTQSYSDGLILTFKEDNVPLSAGLGKSSSIMQTYTLNDTPDQVLQIRARVSPGNISSNEVFYAQISTDGSFYTIVGQIDQTSWKWYNFTLPPVVANKIMYLKITDSSYLESSASVQDQIELDYVAVVTDLFSGYTQINVESAVTSWKAVRAADIDKTGTGYAYKEVVVGNNGAGGIQVWRYSGTWGAMSGTDPGTTATFYVECSAMVTGSKYPFASLAPTLFDAVDINGDGFTDLLVCNYTSSGSGSSAVSTSTIGFHMNTYTGGAQSWRYFQLHSWSIIGNQGGTLPGPWITVAIAANLQPT